MKIAIDSSVLVSALCADDANHLACREVLLRGRPCVFIHAFSETFSTLTGGRLGFRIPSADAANLLRMQIAPKLVGITLTQSNLFEVYEEAEARGVRGGAIYDYLHLAAARKAGAKRIYTLNGSDFEAFHRPGDPEIMAP